jgi:hypothetical protein
MTYTMYMHCIYNTYSQASFSDPFKLVLQGFKEANEMEIHVCCVDFQDNYLIALKGMIYCWTGYTRDIPGIYMYIPDIYHTKVTC